MTGQKKFKNMSQSVWSDFMGKKLLLIAMCIVLLTHGIVFYYTMPKTYDAFVHIFFADHYAKFWFEPWEYRWYTGFLTISYPPLIHQATALLSKLFPLKVAFCIYTIIIYEILIVGVYRFTKIFYDKPTAGVASVLAALLSSIVQTVHVYGQIPTLTGLAFLLNALPFLYLYITKNKTIYLIMTLSFLSVTVSSHHVTAIFGQVFFIAPTLFMALVDLQVKKRKKISGISYYTNIVKTALSKYKQILFVIVGTIILAICLIFPYWYWSKTDPITQVSIPHGSRDNFFENISSGLMFFIIPLALVIALLPAIGYRITNHKRHTGWAVSFFLCLLLGTGGTTNLPKMLLGEGAFNILTLDRFSFWASIIAIPFMAKYIYSFLAGTIRDFLVTRHSGSFHFLLSSLTGFVYFLFLIFIFHLSSFRPLQPKEIDVEPIINFLNRDEHMRWRYLTLGFGDQMAWLSANTLAASVDGNYHSARKLPELTTRPIERLENAKFAGDDGLASLKDFLSNAEKYNLKYVFNNDRYYDPLLYYYGWNRTIRLENGIMVWEKGNITTIKPVRPKAIPSFMKIMWGIFPMMSLVVAFFLTIYYLYKYKEEKYKESNIEKKDETPIAIIYSSSLLPIVFFSGYIIFQVYELLYVCEQKNAETAVYNFYNHLDFQRFDKAFRFFVPSITYPLDQYLLEKSVTDGGLLPSYAKLDSIHVGEIKLKNDTADVAVYTRWNTSLGFETKLDTLHLVMQNKKWYIIPNYFTPEIPEEQVRSYIFTLFKKQGKRWISSFPTLKDDRVKKPFVQILQANIIQNENKLFVTGEVINVDDIPVNMALKVTIQFSNGNILNFYPDKNFIYNLAPKANSFFQIDLNNLSLIDTQTITSFTLYTETDVSERGYIHGGTIAARIENNGHRSATIHSEFYNELPMEINVPGILVAEKDSTGTIWQTKLITYPTAVRSGLHIQFQNKINLIKGLANKIETIPFNIQVNGQHRILPKVMPDHDAQNNGGISIIPHCFISQEIFLQ